MLTELTIRNVGVIEDATFSPGPGLTVVTGETGAGKTMVVQGLGLVAGVRADSAVVRNREGSAQVDARFIDIGPECADEVDSAGGTVDDGELLVARQVAASGRSRSWIGGASVTQAVAVRIGSDLVTIHGQADQVRLSTAERQRQVLDRAAGPQMAAALDAYRALYDQRKALVQELDDLTRSAQERAREADMLAFGVAEIAKIAPEEGEDQALRDEARRLQDADDLRSHALTAVVALAGDDMDADGLPVLTLLSQVRRALGHAAQQDTQAQALAVQADEASALVTDLAGQVSSYLADLVADPIRLEWIETRLAELSSLTRKYGPDATAVREWAVQAQNRLAQLEGSDSRISELAERIESLTGEVTDLAASMTRMRADAATRFAAQVAQELGALAMPHARVEFLVTPLADLGPWGGDAVALMFTANPGSEPAPLGKVASGGELSRVRLAIEVVLADSSSRQTFVFDEVDAGIGGAVGLQVGLRLARLAQRGQVIVVTHLAQVAAFADTHYVVSKTDDGQVTASGLALLTPGTRLAELARMMGGLGQSASSSAHAQELLDQAQTMIRGLPSSA
ncbi:MAG: DNA repair protein RecN [Propionibacteriaceae bacterium]|nr:DNA repair protein RecN [Propionibacteriaceae bacterium]